MRKIKFGSSKVRRYGLHKLAKTYSEIPLPSILQTWRVKQAKKDAIFLCTEGDIVAP